MKFKKFLSILMVCIMGAGAVTACAPDAPASGQTEDDKHASESGELKILQSGITIPPEDRISNIKAEYLIENQGYRDDDEVVAILSLGGDALIDSYLDNEELSAKISLAEYAASPMGKQKRAGIEYTQTDLLRRLQSEGYIKSVEYRYQTIANALAVTMTYGDFLALEEAGLCESVALSETYARPLEDGGLDASAIVNDVKVYETGIFNPEDALDPQGNQYTGKGTSVAVLDSGFDLSHQVFNTYQLTNENELMYKRSDIQSFLDNNDTNAEETTEGLLLTDVFYSNKIPYKYDYADKDSDVFPFDSEHGTHVAGIIGGYADSYQDKDKNTPTDESGKPIPFKGIAKDTQLVLMKVFPDLTSGAETDDILAALEDAVLLGVDAINMSLGAACGFSREKDGDVVNEVYDKIDASGTSLITAAGNEYSSGFGGAQGNTNFVTNPDSGTIGSPASYKAALSVASISGVKSKYLIGNDEQVFFFHESNSIAGEENDFFGELYAAMGWEKNGETHTMQYVTVPGYGYRANYTTVDVKGKIALVSRGDNTFEDKALQAKTAGAAACIIYNNIEGDILMSMGKSDHIPTVSISKEDGVKLAQKREGTLTFSYDQEAGPFMSDFSCWGPLPDLTLKPEITAHGGNITSSAPGGGFITISGTSMACPNLCGVVVLIRQYIKDNYTALTGKTDTDDDSYMLNIKNLTNKLLMSTGTIILNEQGNPYSPRKQGAGLASLPNVVNTRAYIEVEKNGKVQDRPKLELGDDAKRTGVYEMYFDVVNISDKPAEYNVGIIGMTESVSSADENFVAERDQILGGNIKVEALSTGDGTVSGTSVSVNAKSTLKLKLTYTLSQADKDLIDNSFPYGMYVEGFVTLTAKEDADVDLNVPFLAYYGDWTQAPIFDKTYYEVETEAHNAGIDEEDKIKADYYATTPYGSYWYNYIIPLGTYLYQMDESQYDPIPATEDRIAISNTLNSIDGISNVYAGLLRSCKTMMYTITDKATGEVIFTKEVTNARKAFSQGGSPIPNYEELKVNSAALGLVNNRQYEFKMEGFLDYGDGGEKMNARNTFSFDFTLDSEAPIIKSASYEKIYDKTLKKDRYYVTLTVYDNTYAMSVAPGAFTDNPDYDGSDQTSPVSFTAFTDLPIPLYGSRGEEVNVRIEITDYLADLKQNIFRNGSSPTSALPLNNCLVFSIDDYALNQNLFLCSLPGTEGPFAFTNDGTEEGTAMVNLSIGVNEVVDLTQYLVTSDLAANGDKDYLKYLVWQSSNPSNVAVQDGQIRGLKTGRSTITVYEPMNGQRATLSVLVVNRATSASVYGSTGKSVSPLAFENADDATQEKIKDLRFSSFKTLFAHAQAGQSSDIGSTGETVFLTAHRGGISMYPGETIQLSYDVTPWYVKDNYTYTYKVDREDVAIVKEDGTVQALKKGNAIVTLRVYDKNGKESNIMATLRITVNSEFVIDDARTLVAYKGMGGDVVIPNDEGILYIGPFSFSLYETNNRYAQELPENDIYANRIPQHNESIRSVVVPDGVTEIQQNAFYHCTALEKVVLPDTVRFLRKDTFTGDTALNDINLGNVEVIASNAFAGCNSLKTVDLSKCYSIDDAAFKGSGLTEVDVTKLRNAGPEAFMNCKSLAKVTLGPLTKLAEHIFDGCILTSVECAESNIIPAYAFANNKLTSVKLSSENGLDLIGDYAFAGNADLAEFTLPNSDFTLGQNVFSGCKKLATVRLQQKTRIASVQGAVLGGSGVSTFALADGVSANDYYNIAEDGKQLVSKDGSELLLAAIGAYTETLTVSAEIKSIGASAFAGAALKGVTFSGPVSIGEYAFAGCSALTKVTFASSSGTEVGNYAFYNCKLLDSADNLNNAVKIGDNAFASDPALKTVTLGDNVTVGNEAFRGSGLTTVTLGKDATLGAYAFADCATLQTVTMPNDGGVKIGGAAFANDTRLSTIDLAKATGELGAEAFYSCRALLTANLTNITKVGANAFTNCAKLNSVTLGENLISIGDGAFMDLTYVTGGNSHLGPVFTTIDLTHVTELGEMAFLGCSKLSSVTLPSLAEIPAFAFAYCTSLSTLALPQNCTKIGDFAFANCTALTSLTNMDNVTEIGEGAFNLAGGKGFTLDLSAVKTVGEGAFADSTLSGQISATALTSVGSFAFENAAFTSINAPALAVIGEGAFAGNKALTSFNFSAALESVGTYAFYGCTSLADFTFGTDKAKEGKINDYAKLIDGVLYTALLNGKQQLTSVPAGKNIAALTVAEGTSRIDAYAGNANTHVTSIVLPDSLDIIGEFAFYGYTGLKNVEFRSITAPKLESGSVVLMTTGAVYDVYGNAVGTRLSETAPGYELLHDLFSLYGEEMYYFNFIALSGSRAPITMTLPKNSDISGYDNIVYRAYFAVDDATRSNYTAMEQSMKDFLWLGKQVAAIENVMLTDETLVSKAVVALNSVKQDPAAYDIDPTEWNALKTSVLAARDRIARLKIEYAKKSVRDIQARIDALDDTYKNTAEQDAEILALRDAIGNLKLDDRSLLIQDKYTTLLAAYQAAHPTTPDPGSGGDNPGSETPPEESDSGCGCVIGIGGGIAALAILLGAALIVTKKKEN